MHIIKKVTIFTALALTLVWGVSSTAGVALAQEKRAKTPQEMLEELERRGTQQQNPSPSPGNEGGGDIAPTPTEPPESQPDGSVQGLKIFKGKEAELASVMANSEITVSNPNDNTQASYKFEDLAVFQVDAITDYSTRITGTMWFKNDHLEADLVRQLVLSSLNKILSTLAEKNVDPKQWAIDIVCTGQSGTPPDVKTVFGVATYNPANGTINYESKK